GPGRGGLSIIPICAGAASIASEQTYGVPAYSALRSGPSSRRCGDETSSGDCRPTFRLSSSANGRQSAGNSKAQKKSPSGWPPRGSNQLNHKQKTPTLIARRFPLRKRKALSMSTPIRLSDSELEQIFRSAQPLPVADRDRFLQEIATRLAGTTPGPGTIFR